MLKYLIVDYGDKFLLPFSTFFNSCFAQNTKCGLL